MRTDYLIANFCPTSDVHFTTPTLQELGETSPEHSRSVTGHPTRVRNVIMSVVNLVVSTIRTKLQINLMLWEM